MANGRSQLKQEAFTSTKPRKRSIQPFPRCGGVGDREDRQHDPPTWLFDAFSLPACSLSQPAYSRVQSTYSLVRSIGALVRSAYSFVLPASSLVRPIDAVVRPACSLVQPIDSQFRAIAPGAGLCESRVGGFDSNVYAAGRKLPPSDWCALNGGWMIRLRVAGC